MTPDAIDERPTAAGPATCDVLVVGGGITGTSTAWHLARAGVDVLLVDRHDLNTQASGRNAGSLHGQIQHAPFLQRGDDWALGFLPALGFLVESLKLWHGLEDDLGVDLEVATKGGLLVAETDEQLRVVEAKARIERAAGFDARVLSASELQDEAPYVSSAMAGAQLSPVEGKANPLLAAPALARAAMAAGARIRGGLDVHGGERVDGRWVVETSAETIHAGAIVGAADRGLVDLESIVGARLPLVDEPVQVAATEAVEPFVDHLLYFAGDKLTLKQAKAGTVLIGGGWPSDLDPASGRLQVNGDSLRRNLAVAQRVVPAVGGLRMIRAWPGVGVGTPDLMPIIGDVGRGVFVGVFPHMGFTAGPLMGQTLARLVLGVDVGLDLAPFDPSRF